MAGPACRSTELCCEKDQSGSRQVPEGSGEASRKVQQQIEEAKEAMEQMQQDAQKEGK
jgi:hypothetical protein